ncbi:MAG: HD domain-containing protein [Bacteriovoracaceae bacterium]|nr:HD domain-containing protein [Bacteriovoracaceae bacterium]
MNENYKAINVFYLTPNQILEFDIYIHLPVNNKFIKYLPAEEPLDETQILKLKLKSVNELFINENDLEKYNRFLSSSIQAKIRNGQISDSEKTKIIRDAAVNVMESISSINGDGDAISWTNHCIETTKTLVTHITDESTSTMYDKLMELTSDRPSLINHSLLVSSLSVIFGMALGIFDSKTISELSIGGLLHDIGLSKISDDIVEKYLRMDVLEAEEINVLKMHPGNGLELIKKALRSPKITDNIINIISDHHENASGTGYPLGKGIPSLSYLCRIVAIVDRVSLQLFHLDNQAVDIKYLVSKLFKAQKELREFDKNMLGQLLETIK